MVSRVGCSLLLFSAVACRSPVELPGSSVSVPALRVAPAAAPQPVRLASDETWAAAPKERQRCPDELLPRGVARETTLAVRVRDARGDRRQLLPLSLRTALETPGSNPEARYFAELRIDSYSSPRLFRRLNAPRSEWAAGSLQGSLLIQDTQRRSTLCQAPLRALGDAREAPISRRMRESTRRALETKLRQRTRGELDGTLAKISSVFTLETLDEQPPNDVR